MRGECSFLFYSENENCLRFASARKCETFALTKETPLKGERAYDSVAERLGLKY